MLVMIKKKRLSKEQNAYLQEKVTFPVYVRFEYTHEFWTKYFEKEISLLIIVYHVLFEIRLEIEKQMKL